MATATNVDKTIKQRHLINRFFIVFRFFILLLNSMTQGIHNHCTRKPIVSAAATYVYVNDQLRLFCNMLSRFVEVLDIHL